MMIQDNDAVELEKEKILSRKSNHPRQKIIDDFLKRITYKPGAEIHACYKNWSKYGNEDFIELCSWLNVINLNGQDTIRIRNITNVSTWEVFEDNSDKINEEIFLRRIKAVLRDMEIHELEEWLRIDGQLVYEPHPELNLNRTYKIKE